MKIQRNTLVLALVALGLSSGIYLQQRLTAPESSRAVRTEGAEPLFDFAEADVVEFTITRPDLTLSLSQPTAASSGDDVADLLAETAAVGQPDWAITAPEQTPASDGAVAFLLNLLATGDCRDRFSIAQEGQSAAELQQRLGEFGLDQPKAQVDLTLGDGTTHQLLLGDDNFDGSGIYAMGDRGQSPGKTEIFLVDSSLEPAMLRPLEEWRYTAELPDDSESTLEPPGDGEIDGAEAESPSRAPEPSVPDNSAADPGSQDESDDITP